MERSHRTYPARTWSSYAACVLVALLCATLPLAGGRPSLAVDGGIAVASLAAAALMLGSGRRFPVSGLPLLALPVACLLQLVPLPPSWIAAIAPATDRLLRETLAPLGEYPATRPLSLDAAATARGLVMSVACIAVFWVASACAGASRRTRLVLAGLGAGAAAMVAAVLLGAALGWTGVLEPRFPLVNPNHLAAFLDLAAFAALGLALESHEHRLAWLLVFAASVAVIFLSLSRGGISALLVGVVVFWATSRRPARDQQSGARSGLARWWMPPALAAGLGLAAYLAVTPIVAELRSLGGAPGEAKVQLWAPAVAMIRDNPVVGVGRGAFGSAFPAYKRDDNPVTYSHLENEWLQLLVELGVPAGLLVLSSVAWTWLHGVRHPSGSYRDSALLAGISALVLHELGDFALEVPGVLIAFGASLGLATHAGPSTVLDRRWARAALASMVVVVLTGGAVAVLGGRATHGDMPADPEGTVEWARRAARWTPADYFPHAAAGARLAQAARCQEAMPWLERAMLLGPTIPEPHRFAGRCLRDGGRDAEAKREYRLAVAYHDPVALEEAVEGWRRAEDLIPIATDSPEGLLALGGLLGAREPGAARQVYSRLYADFLDARALVPLARAALASGDAQGALEAGRAREAMAPPSAESFQVAALALDRLGRPEEAREEAVRGLDAAPGSATLLGYLSDRSRAAGHYSEAIRLAEAIAPQKPAEAAEREFLVARALRDQGRLGEAIERAQSGAEILQDQAGPLIFVSDLLRDAGRFDEAIERLERATALAGKDAFRDRVQAIRAAAAVAEEARRRRRLIEGDSPLPAAPGP